VGFSQRRRDFTAQGVADDREALDAKPVEHASHNFHGRRERASG